MRRLLALLTAFVLFAGLAGCGAAEPEPELAPDGRRILTLGLVNTVLEARTLVSLFNAQSGEYKVEIVEYKYGGSGSTPDDLTLDLTLTASGRAVAFSWHDNTRAGDFAETDGLLAPALALLGVDDFADWQTVDWGGRLPHAGETAYSPTAQLYVSVNANGGLTVAAASMTPEEFAALLA